MGLRCILKAAGASEEKLSALEAFVPPTDFQVKLENLTRPDQTLIKVDQKFWDLQGG